MHGESKISVGSIVFSFNFCDVMWKPASSETHNLQRVFRPGGVLPYIWAIWVCARQRVWFFSRFGLK